MTEIAVHCCRSSFSLPSLPQPRRPTFRTAPVPEGWSEGSTPLALLEAMLETWLEALLEVPSEDSRAEATLVRLVLPSVELEDLVGAML